MNPTRRFARFRQAGFTLIELMVGMAIGLLATIIIMQVMSLFEAQRRTTTGSVRQCTQTWEMTHCCGPQQQRRGVQRI